MSKTSMRENGYSVDVAVRPHEQRGYIVTVSCRGKVIGERRAYSWREARYYVNQGMILFDPKTKTMSRPLD